MYQSMIRNGDRLLVLIQEWAEAAHFNLESHMPYIILCQWLTILEDKKENNWREWAFFFQRIDLYFQLYKTSRWEIVSEVDGEIFDLYGEPGENAGDAMKRMGFNLNEWRVWHKIY